MQIQLKQLLCNKFKSIGYNNNSGIYSLFSNFAPKD